MVQSRGQAGRRPRRAETADRTRPERTARAAGWVRGAVLTVVAATLTIGLTSCTGTPDPAPSPPVSTAMATPSSPATPSPDAPLAVAAPERPAAMDRDDAEGAIAAATYFISLYSYAYATGELEEWKAMSDPECVFCQSVRDDNLTILGRGERSEGGSISVVGTPTTHTQDEGVTYQVETSIDQDMYRTYDKSGLIIEERPPQSGQMAIAVTSFVPGRWRVTAVSTEQATQ